MEKQMTFQEDDAVITKLFIMEAGLSKNARIIRVAGIVDTLKSAAEPMIKSMQERFKKDGILPTLTTYIVDGLLMRGFGGWFGLCIGIALQAFGIEPGQLVKWVWDYITNGVNNGSITANSNPQAMAKDLVSNNLTTTASLNLLHKLNKNGELHVLVLNKQATKNTNLEKTAGSWFTSLLGLFSGSKTKPNIGQAKGFLGGALQFLISVVFTAIVGIISVEGISAFKQYMTSGSSTSTTEATKSSGGFSILDPSTWTGSSKPTETKPQPKYQLPPIIPHTLKASGQGEQYHINDDNTNWVVGLVDGSVKQTLIYWAVTIYPQLRNYADHIDIVPSFGKMLSLLSREYDPNFPKGLIILPNSDLHTWREIVDHFVGEVVQRIKEIKPSPRQLATRKPGSSATEKDSPQPIAKVNPDLKHISRTDVMDDSKDTD